MTRPRSVLVVVLAVVEPEDRSAPPESPARHHQRRARAARRRAVDWHRGTAVAAVRDRRRIEDRVRRDVIRGFRKTDSAE